MEDDLSKQLMNESTAALLGIDEHYDMLMCAMLDELIRGDPEVIRCFRNGYMPPMQWNSQSQRWARITVGVAPDKPKEN